MAKTRAVGLDIGTTGVRAVEVEYGNDGPAAGSLTVLRAGEVALPAEAVRDGEVVEPETVSSALKSLWDQGKFADKNVVIGVGNQRVLVRDLDLPWLPLDQLKQSLPYQTQELLPGGADDALLDYYPTGEKDGETGRMFEGIFVAAVRDTVVANVLAVEGAGLLPLGVDLNAFALLRPFLRSKSSAGTVAIVDIGARVTNVIVAEHGMPRFVRIIAGGGLDITGAVASAMQCTAADAERIKREVGVGFKVPDNLTPAAEATGRVSRTLVEAVHNSMVYYNGQRPGSAVDTLIVTGGSAMMPGLGQYLSTALRLPAQLGNPFESVTFGKGIGADGFAGNEHRWAVALGLAMGETK